MQIIRLIKYFLSVQVILYLLLLSPLFFRDGHLDYFLIFFLPYCLFVLGGPIFFGLLVLSFNHNKYLYFIGKYSFILISTIHIISILYTSIYTSNFQFMEDGKGIKYGGVLSYLLFSFVLNLLFLIISFTFGSVIYLIKKQYEQN
jgi:hypothetical protein